MLSGLDDRPNHVVPPQRVRATLTILYRHGMRSRYGDLNRFVTARVSVNASRLNAPSQPTASAIRNNNSRTPPRPLCIGTFRTRDLLENL